MIWRKRLWPVAALVTVFLFVCGTAAVAQQPAEDKVQRSYGNVFAKRDERQLLADIYQPAGPGPFPGVLMIHGGGWMSGSRWNMVLHANALAAAGYVVVNIEYRLAPAHKYPAQLHDCLDGYRWMCNHADELRIDTDRLALYGYSAGAHLACLVGLNPPDEPGLVPPKAIVGGGTPCDFEWVPEESSTLAYFMGGSRKELPELYRDASPISHVTADDPPVFLFHGEVDPVVPIESAERMVERLQDTGVNVEFVTIPDQGHVAPFLDPQSPQRAIRFLDAIWEKRAGESKEPGEAEQQAVSEAPDDGR